MVCERIAGIISSKYRNLYHRWEEKTLRRIRRNAFYTLWCNRTGYSEREQCGGKNFRKKELTLHIDLKPALSEEQLDKRILREFDANHNKQYKNSIDSLFPAKLKPVMIELSEIEPEKKVNEITKEERQRLVHLIKDFTMTLTGLRSYNEAIITKGGVSVKEIDPGTMESKKMKGLYFAGEVLDLDAVTGGYNLQIAWSTGYLAGMNAGCD